MYVKSVLAGVAALFIASVLYFYIYAFWVLPKAPPGTLVGVDVRTVFATAFLAHRAPRLRNRFPLGISKSLG